MKEESNKTGIGAVTPTPVAEPKKITLTEEQLNDMLGKAQADGKKSARTGQALNQGGWEEFTPEKGQNKMARMKLYRKDSDDEFSLIIDWKRLRFDFNEITRQRDKEIFKLTLLTPEGKEDFVELEWAEFMKINDFEDVEIIATTEKLLRRSHGLVRKSPVVKGYTFSKGFGDASGVEERGKSPGMVEAIEIKTDHTHVIQRPNGQKITIHNSRLNA